MGAIRADPNMKIINIDWSKLGCLKIMGTGWTTRVFQQINSDPMTKILQDDETTKKYEYQLLFFLFRSLSNLYRIYIDSILNPYRL